VIPPLRLSHKLFAGLALVGVVVSGLAAWILLATGRMTDDNRAIVQEALPAVRLELALLEGVAALRRLEARHAVLRDPSYLELFRQRVRAMTEDLSRLEASLTPDARGEVVEARARLVAYAAAVLGSSAAAAGNPASRGEPPSQRLEASLEALYAASLAELRQREAATRRVHEQSRWVALAGIGLSLLLGLAIAVATTLTVARPLRRLEAAAQQVALRRASTPIPVRGQDEVATLTRAFNHMTARLAEIDALKDELFATVSHDLRTPLAAVRWSADLLAGGVPGPLTAKQLRLAENIRTSSTRLLDLVEQLLDLGRLDAGQMPLDLRPTDLRGVIAQCVDEVRPLADQGRIELAVTLPAEIPTLLVDPQRMHQVLVNLLGNAIKFTPAAGRVGVEVAVEPGAITVRVRDTGIGIPAELLPVVFDRYRQAHAGRGGTGIGLTVVKGLVEAHGGRVWAESEQGRGSCFGFTLPHRPPDALATAPARRQAG
jgi:signal transduction histidine kinase